MSSRDYKRYIFVKYKTCKEGCQLKVVNAENEEAVDFHVWVDKEDVDKWQKLTILACDDCHIFDAKQLSGLFSKGFIETGFRVCYETDKGEVKVYYDFTKEHKQLQHTQDIINRGQIGVDGISAVSDLYETYKKKYLDVVKEPKPIKEVVETLPKHIQYKGLPKDYKTTVGTYATVLKGGVKSGNVIKFIFNNYVLLTYATPKKVFVDGAIVMTDRLFSKITNNNFSMCGALTSTGTFKLVISSPKKNTENKEVLSKTRKMLNNSVIVNKRFRVCLECVNSIDEVITICNLFASKVKYISNFITNHGFIVDKFSCFGLIPYEEPVTCQAKEEAVVEEVVEAEVEEPIVEETVAEEPVVEEPTVEETVAEEIVETDVEQDDEQEIQLETVKDYENLFSKNGIPTELIEQYKQALWNGITFREVSKPTLNDRLNKLWKNVIKPIKTIKRFVKYIRDFKDV